MDAATAKELLQDIQKTKKAWFSGPASVLPSFGGSPSSAVGQQVQQYHNQQLQADAKTDIVKALLLAGGIGAAVRGAGGLQDMFTNKRVAPQRVVEMPVPYPTEDEEKKEKKANNDLATSKIGLNYYLPSMLLGAPLAAYGGWKGVDALLNSQKRDEREQELEEAKRDYEKALLGSYKKATAAALDSAFSKLQKTAVSLTTPFTLARDVINQYAPNLEGAATGGLLTAGLLSAPLGYMLVNKAMKKNSRRSILQKALAERARRQAKTQPPEIYAIPQPQEQEGE